jgi:hypothetical protein
MKVYKNFIKNCKTRQKMRKKDHFWDPCWTLVFGLFLEETKTVQNINLPTSFIKVLLKFLQNI